MPKTNFVFCPKCDPLFEKCKRIVDIHQNIATEFWIKADYTFFSPSDFFFFFEVKFHKPDVRTEAVVRKTMYLQKRKASRLQQRKH